MLSYFREFQFYTSYISIIHRTQKIKFFFYSAFKAFNLYSNSNENLHNITEKIAWSMVFLFQRIIRAWLFNFYNCRAVCRLDCFQSTCPSCLYDFNYVSKYDGCSILISITEPFKTNSTDQRIYWQILIFYPQKREYFKMISDDMVPVCIVCV